MRFRLMTYNIHKAIGRDGAFLPERIALILEHHDADIVLLQEVDRGVPRSNHEDLASALAQRLRYDYRAVGMNVYLRKGMYGNATLTRFPIGRQRNIDLTQWGHKRRGAQHATITLPDGRNQVLVEVFNVHLGLSARERNRQVARLMESAVLVGLPGDQPCIVAGDMNDWRGVLKRRHFAPRGFRCATNRRPDSRWSIRTYPSFAPTGGLDKIFYRGALKLVQVYRSRLKLAQVASDHLPVIAEFEVEA